MKRTAAKGRSKRSTRGRNARPISAKPRTRPTPVETIVANRQKRVRVDVALLRRITRAVIAELPAVKRCELGIQFVSDEEMTSINETFLQHTGTTDVITFDHRNTPSEEVLYGELFICADEAVRQARRFRTSWQEELVRYLVHGVLHLHGFDDRTPALRHRMKREENRLLKRLRAGFPLRKLQRALNSAHD